MSSENSTINQEKNREQREQIVSEAEKNLSDLISWIDVLTDLPQDQEIKETTDGLIKKLQTSLRELR